MTESLAAVADPRYKPSSLHAVPELLDRFPPRRLPTGWEVTRASRGAVLARALAQPLLGTTEHAQSRHHRGVKAVVDWLAEFPGSTWQDRFLVSTREFTDNLGWKHAAAEWWSATRPEPTTLKSGLNMAAIGATSLICADVLRPPAGWLMTPRTPKNLAARLEQLRDPRGWAALRAVCDADPAGHATKMTALCRIAVIQAAKGGVIADITVGDCLQLLQVIADIGGGKTTSGYFYHLLHAIGTFPAAAPSTVRVFGTSGQSSVEQLIDRYRLACRPIRDLLVDYLRERESTVDYVTLQRLAGTLGKLFWADLEHHHPGIDSLRLAPEIAAAWKQRILARESGLSTLAMVRAFYLDIAQWAMEEPTRWGPWAAPCPIRADEMRRTKSLQRRKSRMDQRTRERLPVLPTLVASVNTERRAAAELLAATQATAPGHTFTAAGQTLRRSTLASGNASAKIWAEDPDTGVRRDLTFEEHQSFWAWAVVEVLRHTGLRIEELCELNHHSFVEYTLPSSGELIPLLHIAPSKTDSERLLVISPELADVLSAIVCRIRDTDGAVPLVAAYDYHEKVWNPLMPLLFQRHYGGERRPIIPAAVRRLLNAALAKTGLTDTTGQPLRFLPHDFRRIFITDAVLNGMPPHIAQLVVGHRDINTTMGYKAVYPEEVITAHRAFLARRRALRPSDEYRTPTDTEWDEFLGHFEHRKLSLGTCGRAYSTPCIHEHSCLRCPLLRPDPHQRARLIEIRDNLRARIDEARRESWLGEVEGLQISLAGTNQKLAQLDELVTRAATVHLGIPHFTHLVGRTLT
ncbi:MULTISPECIES: site-specific integrase [Mycolicibacterium]|uniref:tyrosine-type recombinase/integrase n=1 Tax=Mycolicibacterium TaxID=1866885 RepID=UPI00076AD44B|nr:MULTISPECIES: site-specific integrase [Mycolicibacterium]GCA97472.1 integrase [Mycolicibacterium sp. NCC-Tsukiji]